MNDVNENSEKTSEGKNRLAEIEQKIREYGIVSNVDSSEKNLKGLDDAQYDYELFLITLGTLYHLESVCMKKSEKNSILETRDLDKRLSVDFVTQTEVERLTPKP